MKKNCLLKNTEVVYILLINVKMPTNETKYFCLLNNTEVVYILLINVKMSTNEKINILSAQTQMLYPAN